MIRQIQLLSWGGFTDAMLGIDRLAIVAGANLQGETDVINALRFLQRISTGLVFHACLVHPRPLSLAVLIGTGDESQDYRYDLTVGFNGTVPEIIKEELTLITHGYQVATKKCLLHACKSATNKAITAQVAGQQLELSHFYSALIQVRHLDLDEELQGAINKVLNDFQKIFVLNPTPEKMQGYSRLTDDLRADGSNIAGVLAGLQEREGLGKTLTHYANALLGGHIKRVWAESTGRFKTDAMLYCEEEYINRSIEIDAKAMSGGTLRLLAVLTALLTRPADSLLVIEGVDDGLHPLCFPMLLEMLKELPNTRNINVLVTVHSPALLDAATPTMLPCISVVRRKPSTGGERFLDRVINLDGIPKLLATSRLGSLMAEGL